MNVPLEIALLMSRVLLPSSFSESLVAEMHALHAVLSINGVGGSLRVGLVGEQPVRGVTQVPILVVFRACGPSHTVRASSNLARSRLKVSVYADVVGKPDLVCAEIPEISWRFRLCERRWLS